MMSSSLSGKQEIYVKNGETETFLQHKSREPTSVRIKVSPFIPAQDQPNEASFYVPECERPRKSNNQDYFDSFWFLLRFQHYPKIKQLQSQLLNNAKNLMSGFDEFILNESDDISNQMLKIKMWLAGSRIPPFEDSNILRDGDEVELQIIDESSHLCKTSTHPKVKEKSNNQIVDHNDVTVFEKSNKDRQSEINKSEKVLLENTSKCMEVQDENPKSEKRKSRKRRKQCISEENEERDSSTENAQDKFCVSSKKDDETKSIKTHKDEEISKPINIPNSNLLTDDIRKLLEKKVSELEFQKNEKSADDMSSRENDETLSLPEAKKRKRVRRRKKKTKSEEQEKPVLPKPPPNYKMNLHPSLIGRNKRKCFDDSDQEDLTENSLINENERELSKENSSCSVEEKIKKDKNAMSNCVTESVLKIKPVQNIPKGTDKVSNNNLSSVTIGTSVNPSTKFHELLTKARKAPPGNRVNNNKKDDTSDFKTNENNLSTTNTRNAYQIVDSLSKAPSDFSNHNSTPGKANMIKASQDYTKEHKKGEAPPKSLAFSTVNDKQSSNQMSNNSNRTPEIGDRIVFKMMELSEDYTPGLSAPKIGKVMGYDASSDNIQILLQNKQVKTKRVGRFELDLDEDADEGDDSMVESQLSLLHDVEYR